MPPGQPTPRDLGGPAQSQRWLTPAGSKSKGPLQPHQAVEPQPGWTGGRSTKGVVRSWEGPRGTFVAAAARGR